MDPNKLTSAEIGTCAGLALVILGVWGMTGNVWIGVTILGATLFFAPAVIRNPNKPAFVEAFASAGLALLSIVLVVTVLLLLLLFQTVVWGN